MLDKILDILVPATLVLVFFWLLSQEPVRTMNWQNIMLAGTGYWLVAGMVYLVPDFIYQVFVQEKN